MDDDFRELEPDISDHPFRRAPGQTPVAMWARNRHLAALVERSTHGTRKLATERLLDFTIPLPPREEQESIAAHLHELEGELREHLDEFSRLANDARTAFARLLPAVPARHFRHSAYERTDKPDGGHRRPPTLA